MTGFHKNPRLLQLLVLGCVGLVVPTEGKNIVFPAKGGNNNPSNRWNSNPGSCPNNRIHKISLDQSGYVQYSEFVTPMPELSSLTVCYWIRVNDTLRGATPLNYGLDESANFDNITLVYNPPAGIYGGDYTLTINGQNVYTAKFRSRTFPGYLLPLRAREWTHYCHSWSGLDGRYSVWSNGENVVAGVASHSIGWRIPSGGTLVTGQHQNTIMNAGMDNGQGVVGDLTLVQVYSSPLPATPDRAAYLVRRVASQCTGGARGGDIVDWNTTPQKGFGGVTTSVAESQICGRF